MQVSISLQSQTLSLYQDDSLVKNYTISSAKNGPGQEKNSGCTPLGKHYVRAKIGDNAEINTVFVGRRKTSEVYSEELASNYPGRDWILTRIIWLSGCEIGKNRLGNVDTMQRYIYIHGTPDSEPMGIPLSHGCIRMRNQELIELYDTIPYGTPVLITN